MINTNCSSVLDVIQKNKNISRKKITELTGLSWGGMTKIVNKLLDHEYITERKADPTSKSGRIPSIISINNNKNFVVGLDINKTGFNGTVMNLSGEILKKYSSSVKAKTKTEMLEEIISFTSGIFDDFPSGIIIAIGVAMQGIVDSKKGISVKFPGIISWEDVPLKKILEDNFKVNVFIEHDPDCLLYSHIETKNSKNILLFRIDKSIGMAVSLNSKIIKGKGILEIAHNTVIPDGKKCSCGMKGCLEAYLPSPENQDDSNEFILPLSITIKNMVNIFNADKVILTGDSISHLKVHENSLLNNLKKMNCNISVSFSDSSDHAVLGAALIAIHKAIDSLEI